MKSLFDEPNADLLVRCILSIRDRAECEAFLEDLLTIREIGSISQRLSVAWHLLQEKTFVDITDITGASPVTIGRVSRCIHHGPGGYRDVLSRVQPFETPEIVNIPEIEPIASPIQTSNTSEPTPKASEPVKRGRGRPRKTPK